MQFYPPGTRIFGRYEVVGRPLMGGMGIVYFCFDHEAQRPVALKTFKPEYLPNRVARERFLKEADAWVRLGKHPHIVRCYGVFVNEPQPEVYLVLEWVAKEEGRQDASLRSWLSLGRPLPTEQALLIAVQIARGMAHAAAVIPGFVHRDLKPENVLVGADRLSNAAVNRVRVTDFGLVQGLRGGYVGNALAEGDIGTGPGHLTQMGAVLGTAEYMAPEQWESPGVTAQADIYAFGCILGEMLTGHMLIRGEPRRDLWRAHQGGAALSAIQTAPALLRELLGPSLAADPANRYADWAAMEAALGAAYLAATGQAVPEPTAAAALSRSEQVAAGWSCSEMGKSYRNIGNAQAALGYFQRAWQAGQAAGEHRLEMAGLDGLGVMYTDLGDARRAIGYHEQALVISRAIGNREGEGNALGNLGTAHLRLGDARRAIGYHDQALAISRAIGDRQGQGNDLTGLGNAYMQLGKAQEAITAYEEARTILRAIGDRQAEGGVLGNLGGAYLRLGDARRAINIYEEALTISRQIGDRIAEGTILGNLGAAFGQLGGNRQAIGYHEQALAINREIGDRRTESINLVNIGIAYGQLGDVQRAIGHIKPALAIFRETGDRQGEASVLTNLGNTCVLLGDARQAIGYFEQALAIVREIGDRRNESINLGNLGVIHKKLGDTRLAISFDEQALAIFREIGDLNNIAAMSLNMARLYDQQGIPAQALPLAREAAYVSSQLGQVIRADQARQLVAQLQEHGR
jgi:tetratricopeptide (TPR) repeat protein